MLWIDWNYDILKDSFSDKNRFEDIVILLDKYIDIISLWDLDIKENLFLLELLLNTINRFILFWEDFFMKITIFYIYLI